MIKQSVLKNLHSFYMSDVTFDYCKQVMDQSDVCKHADDCPVAFEMDKELTAYELKWADLIIAVSGNQEQRRRQIGYMVI